MSVHGNLELLRIKLNLKMKLDSAHLGLYDILLRSQLIRIEKNGSM